jgi:hypothetical protein
MMMKVIEITSTQEPRVLWAGCPTGLKERVKVEKDMWKEVEEVDGIMENPRVEESEPPSVPLPHLAWQPTFI